MSNMKIQQYRQQILETLRSDEELGRLADSILPTNYVDEERDDAVTLVTFDLATQSAEHSKLDAMEIEFRVYAHKSLLEPVTPLCTDQICALLRLHFEGNGALGLAPLHCEVDEPYQPGKRYYGRRMVFRGRVGRC